MERLPDDGGRWRCCRRSDSERVSSRQSELFHYCPPTTDDRYWRKWMAAVPEGGNFSQTVLGRNQYPAVLILAHTFERPFLLAAANLRTVHQKKLHLAKPINSTSLNIHF